jgi:hypothetical protein
MDDLIAAILFEIIAVNLSDVSWFLKVVFAISSKSDLCLVNSVFRVEIW